MSWRFRTDIPIYLQVSEEIRGRIFSGVYPTGSKLPGVREIAQEAGVNPNTAQRAFSDLEDSGLILTMRTSGRFVTEDASLIESSREKFIKDNSVHFLSEMQMRGISPEQTLSVLKKLVEIGDE